MNEVNTSDACIVKQTEDLKAEQDIIQPTQKQLIHFKTRVKNTAIKYAHDFENYYVNHEYLICSKAFRQAPYYIVQTYGVQYRHLIGVSSEISAQEFFNKCLDGSLTEEDFSFEKKGQSKDAVKGSVRRKINCLSGLLKAFEAGASVEEGFKKNAIRCSFVSGSVICTVGFSASSPARPMTLLKGNELHPNNSAPLDLVLRKHTGEEKFSEIYVGDEEALKEYGESLKSLLSRNLLSAIE